MCMHRPVERKQTCVEAPPWDACCLSTHPHADAGGRRRQHARVLIHQRPAAYRGVGGGRPPAALWQLCQRHSRQRLLCQPLQVPRAAAVLPGASAAPCWWGSLQGSPGCACSCHVWLRQLEGKPPTYRAFMYVRTCTCVHYMPWACDARSSASSCSFAACSCCCLMQLAVQEDPCCSMT